MISDNLSHVWFKVTNLEVASGEGSWVTTTAGDRYLDFSGGIAVTSTGHSHPHVTAAIFKQSKRFVHAQANVYTHDLMQPLAARLAELSPPGIDTFFYANSGAEITEAAVKLAKQATGRPNIIVFQGSFHGGSCASAVRNFYCTVPERPSRQRRSRSGPRTGWFRRVADERHRTERDSSGHHRTRVG
jgi:4-aminobutyrate aminotransferase-like enzyme